MRHYVYSFFGLSFIKVFMTNKKILLLLSDPPLGFPAGLSRPGKVPGRDRTGPRDLEGPVVLPGQDLETLKVPGPLKKVPGPPGPFFLLQYDQNLQILHFGLYS